MGFRTPQARITLTADNRGGVLTIAVVVPFGVNPCRLTIHTGVDPLALVDPKRFEDAPV